MSVVVYFVEEAEDPTARERGLSVIDAAGYLVQMSAVFVDCCTCAAPRTSRPAFQRALRRLRAGDTFIIEKLWGLGSTVGEVISTLQQLDARKISVVCLDYGIEDINSWREGAFLHALKLAQDLERFTRQARAREAATTARERGVRQGRPNSLSKAQQRKVLRGLKAGTSVAAIARSVNTSRQTVMRLRDACLAANSDRHL